MKYIKIYENFDVQIKKPKFGDFVLINIADADSYLQNFLNNSIGQVISNYPDRFDRYAVKYNNIPKNITSEFIPLRSSIGYYINVPIDKISDIGTKENMAIKLQAKRYNL